VIAIMDGDGAHKAAELAAMLDLLDERVDLVVGTRFYSFYPWSR